MVQLTTVLQGFSASTNEGSIAYCSVTLLRGEKLTLVDVGYHARLVLLQERLHHLGIAPGDIERVILTHAHWDHCFNLAAFPNAEVVLHRAEWEYVQEPHALDWATPPWARHIFDHVRTVTTVEDGDELEPGVRFMAVPGHSPGTLATLIETPEGTLGLVGDALPHRAAAGYVAPGIIFFDEDLARQSARRILDTCRFIYPGHDRPFRIENGRTISLEAQALTLVNPPRDDDGAVRAAISEAPPPAGPIFAPSARRSGQPAPPRGA